MKQFGREIVWAILSLSPDFQSLAVYSLLLEGIFKASPQVRRLIMREKKVIDFIHTFIQSGTDPNKVAAMINPDDGYLQSARKFDPGLFPD